MTLHELCVKLGLEADVKNAVVIYDSQTDYCKIKPMYDKLLESGTWDEGVRDLQIYCGDDPLGMKILSVLLHCLLETYDKYKMKGIPEKIFWDTMNFIPRFIRTHKKIYGVNAFTWAWWFPRQLSMNEFRVGEYEYELIRENNFKKINIHIPSDAKLDKGDIRAIYPFVKKYYPQFEDAGIYCDSWLLAPNLKNVLPVNSNIIQFQNQFSIIRTDENSPYFMDWIYSKLDIPYEELPENTTLQRNVKKFLLEGGKIGTAYGEYCH